MKLKQIFFTLALIIAANINLSAQAPDPVNCEKYTTLYYQYLKQGMYRDAMTFWQMAYNYCGYDSLQARFFSNGRIGYLKLIDIETDSVKKLALRDSLYWIHECLIIKDPNPDWKGKYASMLVTDGDKRFGKIDSLFLNSVHVMKSESSPTYIRQYFKHLIVNKYNAAAAEKKDEVRGFVIEEYMILTDYCTAGAKNKRAAAATLPAEDEKKATLEEDAKKYEGAQEFMDKYLLQIVKDCETLTSVVERKLGSLPKDKVEKSAKVKAYIGLLDSKKCQSTLTYAKLLDTLILLDPTAEAYFLTGKYYKENDNAEKALPYFEKAVEMEGAGANKDKYTFYLASCQYINRKYSQAFKTAKLVEGKEFKGMALEICGNAIAATADGCGETTFQRKANYWLANDYYKKAAAAGADVSTSKYLSNAPDQTEGFNEGVSEGTSVYLVCWGESTTARY